MNAALAIALFVVGAIRHYGYKLGSDEMAGMVSKGLGGAAILCLLAIVWLLCSAKLRGGKAKFLIAVMLWWAWEELQVVLCSALYVMEPWPVEPGQGICSARIGLDLDAIGILVVAILAANATAKIDR